MGNKEPSEQSVPTGQMEPAADSSKQITVEDFDNAVNQPWSGRECIVAQYMKRHGMRIRWSITPYDFAQPFPEARKAQVLFDKHFKCPGDEKKPELQALRASLPIPLDTNTKFETSTGPVRTL